MMDESGVPGIVVAVSVDGETLWAEGIGYADVENRVPCTRGTLMRIGSVSKAIAAAAVAKLWEEGRLDLDKPIQVYVPSFPEKTFQGKKVTLTLRHLLHHLGGIRHYKTPTKNGKDKTKPEDTDRPDAEMEEFYMNRKFKTTVEALELIKDDPLLSEPGSKYLYTTLGWTLVSAAVEGASKESFPKYLNKVLKTIGMTSTYLDKNEPIIYNRARFYHRNDKGLLTNTPCVNSSYKWAGGGLLSNVDDLLLYGNSMLCSLQTPEDSVTPGFLKPSTVKAIWTPASETSCLWKTSGKYAYGMGWVLPAQGPLCAGCKEEGPFAALHTGGSVGASSALVVLPTPCGEAIHECRWKDTPRGVVVAIIGNMSSVGYGGIARQIAIHFAELTK
ncbi:serine beta-lactamase-like protein LACTB, mitochondrial isoform X2 [Ornithodoros turicata]|uniref:serine beta-lactamase-like protein LACTB, mitochondrial isoform X2 n=1 Tax=Ornithodoros turicata TaxID=34597 RepID=UPI00313900CD